MKRRGPVLLAVGAAALAAPSVARAQSTAEIEGLLDEAVVSSATKTGAQSASVAPATTTTITAEDLRRWGVRSLDEALNFLSLGMITENNRETVEIGARGVLLAGDYGDHVLLLVDGHTLNEPWGGTAYFDRGAAVPFEMIDHIEVILGPGSVLYGSNAMLGVINIVTKQAKDWSGLHLAVEGELATSIRGMAGFGKDFRIRGTPSSITMGLEYFASRGPASKFGPQPYGIDSVTGQPKVFSSLQGPTGVWTSAGNPDLFKQQVPSAYLRFTAGGFELSLRAAMFKRWSPFGGGADLASEKGFELDRWVSIDARYKATLSRAVTLTARVYGDLYDYRENDPSIAAEDCLAGQTKGCLYDLHGVSRWIGGEITTSADWLKDGTVVTLIGVDGRVRYTSGSSGDYIDNITGKTTPSGPPYGASEKAFAAFVEQTARPVKWLDLNAGARLDLDERFGFHVSPRVSVAVSPWRGGHFKALYAEAFRAPSAYERYFHDPKFQLVADALKAEVVRSVEGSFEQRAGGQHLLFTVFRSWWRDMVLDTTLSDADIAAAQGRGQLDMSIPYAYQYRNAATVESFGASALYEGIVLSQRLRYGVGVTGAYARQTDSAGGDPYPPAAAAQLFGNARLAYDLGAPWPVLAVAGRFAGSRPVTATSFTPTPNAPPLVEVRGTISGPFPRVRGLSYRVSVNGLASGGGPYAIGPLRSPAPGYGKQELVPLDHLRVSAGLEYVLPL